MKIFRWDIDKTYLDTEFETFSGLVRTATEKASEKKAIAGAIPLVRMLNQVESSSLIFLSGSPKQMSKVLRKKFLLDGITVDDIVLKDSLGAIKKGHFRDVKQQVGYKLPALVKSKLQFPESKEEYLFGDNVEEDALIYMCYSLILSDQIVPGQLKKIMKKFGAYDRSFERLYNYIQRLHYGSTVKRIFIRLVDHRLGKKMAGISPFVTPIHDWFQASIVLWEDQVLTDEQFQTLWNEPRLQMDQKANLIQDLQLRNLIQSDSAKELYQRFGIEREVFSSSLYPLSELNGDILMRLLEELWSH